MKFTLKQFLIGAALLLSVIWAVWAQTGSFEYIRLDDNLYTFDFTPVAGGFSWEGIRGVFSDFTQGGIWMPITSMTYMLDISLFGATPGVHHIASVVWHSANALLVFALFLRLARRWAKDDDSNCWFAVIICLLATLFWSVHPQRNESVAWIASRKDLVFTFFFLVGLHVWLLRNATGRVLGWFFCALACLSKPTAMVFPFIAFIAELLDSDEDASLANRLSGIRLLPYAPLMLMAVATGLMTIYSQTHVSGIDALERGLTEGYGSFSWRCLNAAVALGLYFGQTIVPAGVHIVYRSMIGKAPQGLILGLCMLAVVSAAIVLCIRNKSRKVLWTPLLAAAWFLIAIGPTLGIAGGFGDHARADRFLYLPAMGVSIALIWLLLRIKANSRLLVVCGSVLATLYCGATWWNAKTYATDYSVFARVLEFDSDHWMALAHCGTALCARYGMPDEGIECFRRAMAANPESEDTAAQLVFALATRGHREDHGEIRQYCENLQTNPKLDEKGLATEALGMINMKEMKWDEAIRFFNASIHAPKRKLSAEPAMIRLAMCYHNKGDLVRSEKVFSYLAGNAKDQKIKARSQQALQDIWKKKGQ